MISAANVTKIYRNGTKANDSICMEVNKGDILGIVGANGAGKTTFVRQIAGMLRPTSGTILIDGVDLARNRLKFIKNISYMSQRSYMLESHKAIEVVKFAGIYRGLNNVDAQTHASNLLDAFSLSNDKFERMTNLSGGQVRLVLICSALIASRPVIILDEPTNDVDPQNRGILWEMLLDINKRSKSTIIIVSHNTMELEAMARTVAIFHKSRLEEYSDLQTIKSKYNATYRIAVKCEYAKLDTLKTNLSGKFKFAETDGIEIDVPDGKLENCLSDLAPFIDEHSLEIRVYKTTLAEIYQKVGRLDV